VHYHSEEDGEWKMKVLIVDDEPLILSGLLKIVIEVAPDGTMVCDAPNTDIALEIMKRELPDVTITDINMPEKNGFDLIREARQEGLCDRFIILTGYDEFDYVRQALRSGVVDYLLKPLDKQEIAYLLRRVRDELPVEQSAEYTCHAERILSYLQDHFHDDVSLDLLAEQMSLHPNYISSLFKKETGESFINYLNSIRIKEAQRLLRTQMHMTVSAIGQQVGYESKNYFAKVFKKYTGITPGAYRVNEIESKGVQ
jgi:two-component system response regulator YesN